MKIPIIPCPGWAINEIETYHKNCIVWHYSDLNRDQMEGTGCATTKMKHTTLALKTEIAM